MQGDNPANLELNYLVPTVAVDGHIVFISNDGNVPTLTFFQVRKQEGAKLSADAVASVRMANIADLKNLQKAIEETISKHKSREP